MSASHNKRKILVTPSLSEPGIVVPIGHKSESDQVLSTAEGDIGIKPPEEECSGDQFGGPSD